MRSPPLLKPMPRWLFPLPEQSIPPSLALKNIDTLYQKHLAPVNICSQCFDPDWARKITAAGHLVQHGKRPAPNEYSGIYFEHPNCVGGEETIKLFFPSGLRTHLSGPKEQKNIYNADILGSALQAGFWFWPEPLKTSLQSLSAGIFYQWFSKGSYHLDKVLVTIYAPDKTDDETAIHIEPRDQAGFSDDILMMCSLSLIDPAEIIYRLSNMHTPLADDVLSFPGHMTPAAPFYCSSDTGHDQKVYKEACEDIADALAIRAAQAILQWVTPDWLQNAYFRNVETNPKLADDLSKFERDYKIYTTPLKEKANGKIMTNWPDLSVV